MPEGFNRNFDIALAGGKAWENAFQVLLSTGRVECKLDFRARKTGNLFVETECRGKPSGLTTTEADWWAFAIVGASGDIETFACASVPWLEAEAKARSIVLGGETDYPGGPKVSKGFLLPIAAFANR